jgi:hypothetical protein
MIVLIAVLAIFIGLVILYQPPAPPDDDDTPGPSAFAPA